MLMFRELGVAWKFNLQKFALSVAYILKYASLCQGSACQGSCLALRSSAGWKTS
jgi:hypothetical protein